MSTRLPETIYQWLKYAQFWLLPPTCVSCRQEAREQLDLCARCEASLPRIVQPCRRCGQPLPPGSHTIRHCGTCMVFPPVYTRLLAPYAYQPPLPGLVTNFKYHNRLVNGRVLATCLLPFLKYQYHDSTLPSQLIPVPLHARRLRQRGFNQSLELARWLSKPLDIPVNRDAVIRIRHTPKQTGLSAAERKRNLRGAFRVNKDSVFAPDKPVVIVDDVVTTGTTVAELAKALHRAGAPEVHVWAVARTIV